MKINKISFVWNADFSLAGGLNALQELVKGEHSCSLCEIAYHKVRQTSEWKEYKKVLKKKLACEIEEPCKNQLSKELYEASKGVFPTVLIHTNTGIVSLLAGKAIDDCDGDFNCFQGKLDEALESLG